MKKLKLPKIKLPVKMQAAVVKTGRTLRKHAPEILAVTGAVTIVAGTVKACKDTIALQDDLADDLEAIEVTKQAREVNPEAYTEKMYREDITKAYLHTAGTVVKHYWISAVMLASGIGAMFASNSILRKRCASIGAAFTALKTTFENYRSNVKKEYGEDADYKMMYGVEKKKITTEVIGEDGKVKKVKTEVDYLPNGISNNPYARLFSQSNRYQEDENGRPYSIYNESIIRGAYEEAVMMCIRDKFLYHDDELRLLGMENTITIADKHVGVTYEPGPDDETSDGIPIWKWRKVYVPDDRFSEGVREDFLIEFSVEGDFEEKIQNRKLIAPI